MATKHKFLCLLLPAAFLMSVAFVPVKAAAQMGASCSLETIEPIFCEDVHNEDLYDKYHFGSYKMLEAGTDGWIFRTGSDLKMDFTLKSETLENLSTLNEELKKHGTHLAIMYTPTRGMIHSSHLPEALKIKYGYDAKKAWVSYNKTVKTLRDLGIDVIDLPRPETDMTPFFYKRDHHWNAEGARAAAQAISAHFKNDPVYQSIPKVQFTTKPGKLEYFFGVSKKVFKKLCGTEQPPENIITYTTERTNAAADADSLFGDVSHPEIVLAGTSNSTLVPSMANFEGFLKEFMEADIMNMSVSGGGLDTAMLDYLNSDMFYETPAKILIWEVPSYYDLNTQGRFFREALPASSGICKNPVAEAKGINVKDTNFIGLEDLRQYDVSGSDYYVRFAFEKPVTGPFIVDLRYVKNRERFKFQMPVQTESETRFNLTLRDDKRGILDKVVFSVPVEMTGQKIDVTLCKP